MLTCIRKNSYNISFKYYFFKKRNTVTSEFISADGDINFFEINLKLLMPFVSKKLRVASFGRFFQIKTIEFKTVGCEPNFGKITKNTRIQCYKFKKIVILIKFEAK